MSETVTVCGNPCKILRLLGHGKGGYSYLAEYEGKQVVLKRYSRMGAVFFLYAHILRVLLEMIFGMMQSWIIRAKRRNPKPVLSCRFI